MLLQAVRKWLISIYRLVMAVVLRLWEFLLRVCSSAERPLHFLKVQLQVPAGRPQMLCLTNMIACFCVFRHGTVHEMPSKLQSVQHPVLELSERFRCVFHALLL